MKKYFSTLTNIAGIFALFLTACGGGAPASEETTPLPQTSAPAETEAPTVRSGNGSAEVQLVITNQTSETLEIMWVNFEGVEEPFLSLSPSQVETITSYSTHVWRVYDGAGNLIGEFTLTEDAEQYYAILADKTLASVPPPTPDLIAPLGERSLTDRPDNNPGMYQVHFLYVLPADGTDYQRDLDGKINVTVDAVNEWFAAQTGGSRFRFDTYQGELDITFVQLNMTSQQVIDASVSQYGGKYWIRDVLESELLEMNLFQPGKIYVSLFEISNHPSTCADAAHPDDLMGRMAGLYPSAILDGGYNCADEAFGEGLTYTDMGVIHEIVHTLGFAASCGANPTSAENFSHTGDDNSDLMWAPDANSTLYWDTDRMKLDPGNDDYYNHDIPNCPDLADSAFLDPLPANPQAPPGWPADWKLP
jgi:hypothetical protein